MRWKKNYKVNPKQKYIVGGFKMRNAMKLNKQDRI